MIQGIRALFIGLIGLGIIIGVVLLLVIEGIAAIVSHIVVAWR